LQKCLFIDFHGHKIQEINQYVDIWLILQIYISQ